MSGTGDHSTMDIYIKDAGDGRGQRRIAEGCGLSLWISGCWAASNRHPDKASKHREDGHFQCRYA
jgi:hypothetical protein